MHHLLTHLNFLPSTAEPFVSNYFSRVHLSEPQFLEVPDLLPELLNQPCITHTLCGQPAVQALQ